MSLEINAALIPFKRVFYPAKMTVKDMPYFRVKNKRYGTKGYMYELMAYNSKFQKWMLWHIEYSHEELFKFFRLATPAEEVLYF